MIFKRRFYGNASSKILAKAGIASRRKAEEYILDGKIKVNGQLITELGTKINLDKDLVYYNDKIVELIPEKFIFY